MAISLRTHSIYKAALCRAQKTPAPQPKKKITAPCQYSAVSPVDKHANHVETVAKHGNTPAPRRTKQSLKYALVFLNFPVMCIPTCQTISEKPLPVLSPPRLL